MKITAVEAWEVLDSRGNPTVRVEVSTETARGRFTVPAGASTGTFEALERRDGDDRYRGMGVREAIDAVQTDLAPIVEGRDPTDQRGIDTALVDADGTDDLSRVGANAVLGVSGAAAHAAANALGVPLYELVAPESPGRLPLPMVNMLSGGRHAEGGLEVQDFLVVPIGADSYSAGLEMVHAVRLAVKDRIEATGNRPLVADEGGYAPPLASPSDGLDLVLDAITDAGYTPETEVAIALDLAATQFYDGDRYHLAARDNLSPADLINRIETWVEEYPIVSIEDPLAENDWEGWATLADQNLDIQLLADDLIATTVTRLERAIEADIANAVLVKPNQAGTLTRALDVVDRAMEAGWSPVISARSGETCDSTIADLAVALDAGQIKIGSIARSERLAKYNRLLEIERHHDVAAGPDVIAPN